MPDTNNQNVTELLKKWSGGDADALEKLTPVIYAELYRIAKRYMSRERDGHTLQTSALVNEAYVRLIDWKAAKWENRAHFFGVSANLMRRILIDFSIVGREPGNFLLQNLSAQAEFVERICRCLKSPDKKIRLSFFKRQPDTGLFSSAFYNFYC